MFETAGRIRNSVRVYLDSEMILYWLALCTTLIMVAIGQTFFKQFVLSARKLLLVMAGFCLVIATLSNYIALQNLDIGVVYMSTAFTHLLVLLSARVVLKERLTRDHAVAMVFIILGVVIYVT